jgi:hypothetical protein
MRKHRMLVSAIDSLLNKNHQILIKEVIKLQSTQDRIIDLNNNVQNESQYTAQKININNELRLRYLKQPKI